MKTLQKITAMIAMTSLVAFISCNKDEEPNPEGNVLQGKSQVTVKLSDPGQVNYQKSISEISLYDEVNIDVQQVSIHYGDTASSGEWIALETNAGIYDLTDLGNLGVVLANGGSLPAGYVGQMRLLLGANNSVMVDSVLYDLKTPSAQQSGLKIHLDFTILPGYLYEIYLDFDAGSSIVSTGNGKYLLKPVIRVDQIVEIPDTTMAVQTARFDRPMFEQ
jgi:hypothetical protein